MDGDDKLAEIDRLVLMDGDALCLCVGEKLVEPSGLPIADVDELWPLMMTR